MSFQAPITISEAIFNVHNKKYLLPAIQREFIWDTFQISRLFDSLLKDFPIGSFLFWKVEKQKIKAYQFYEFLRNYHEKYNKHNPKADTRGIEGIIAILDGQQRLTSLYVGLKGTYAYKLPRKFWDNDAAFPERKLYLNLLKTSDHIELEYDFKFLTEEEAKKRDENSYWFRVGDILDLQKEVDVNRYLIKNQIMKLDEEKAEFANEVLFKLHSVIHKDRIINYYLEQDDKLDKVLNIFIRVNSAGTPLSYSDLLLSIATAQWQDKDAREEITKFVDEINNIGSGFNFNKDFVLKACLVLNDVRDIAFKVDNFNKKNMLKIEENWDKVTDSIRTAVKLISSFGYSRYTLTANNVVIPIAYYIIKRELTENIIHSMKTTNERRKIQKWIIISLLKKAFGGQTDNVLRAIRRAINNQSQSFPVEEIARKFRGTTKAIEFNEEEIENMFFFRYGQSYTFSTLAILYPTLDFKNVFHIDHIYPKSHFKRNILLKTGIEEDQIEFYLNNFDYIANLQLLEGIPNIEKSDKDFEKWLFKTFPDEKDRKYYMKKNYIPENIDLSLNNFKEFIEKRKELIKKQLKSVLSL